MGQHTWSRIPSQTRQQETDLRQYLRFSQRLMDRRAGGADLTSTYLYVPPNRLHYSRLYPGYITMERRCETSTQSRCHCLESHRHTELPSDHRPGGHKLYQRNAHQLRQPRDSENRPRPKRVLPALLPQHQPDPKLRNTHRRQHPR